MEPFTKALEAIAGVMRDGAASHPDNDWVRRTPEYHIGRAERSAGGLSLSQQPRRGEKSPIQLPDGKRKIFAA